MRVLKIRSVTLFIACDSTPAHDGHFPNAARPPRDPDLLHAGWSLMYWMRRLQVSFLLEDASMELRHGRPLSILLPEFRVPRPRQARGRKSDSDQPIWSREGSLDAPLPHLQGSIFRA